jgi:hypothetical protein
MGLPVTEKVAEVAVNRVQVVPKKKKRRARAVEAVLNPVPVALARTVEQIPSPIRIKINRVAVGLGKAVEAGRNSAVGTIHSSKIFQGIPFQCPGFKRELRLP